MLSGQKQVWIDQTGVMLTPNIISTKNLEQDVQFQNSEVFASHKTIFTHESIGAYNLENFFSFQHGDIMYFCKIFFWRLVSVTCEFLKRARHHLPSNADVLGLGLPSDNNF